MRMNADISNKNLTILNKKFYNLNLKINNIKLEEKNNRNEFIFIPELKLRILSIDCHSKSILDDLSLIIYQTRNQLEIPFTVNKTLSVNNFSENIPNNNINGNVNNNVNYTNKNVELLVSNLSKTDNFNLRRNFMSGLENSNLRDGNNKF